MPSWTLPRPSACAEHAERGGQQRGGRKSRSRTKIRKMIRSRRKRRSKKRKRISGTKRSTPPGHCRKPKRRHEFILFPRFAWECRRGRSRVPACAEYPERGGRQRGGRKSRSRSRTKSRKMIRSKRKRRSKKRKRISGTKRSTTPGHCCEARRRHEFISFPRSAWECRRGRSRVPAPAPNTQSVEGGIPTGTVGTSTGSSAVVFGEECQIFLVHEEPRCFLHHP